MRRVRLKVSGAVQGVGFRFFTRGVARQLGPSGFVRNLPDGRVEAEAEGDDAKIGEFMARLKEGPSSSRVTGLEVEEAEPSGGFDDFVIRF